LNLISKIAETPVEIEELDDNSIEYTYKIPWNIYSNEYLLTLILGDISFECYDNTNVITGNGFVISEGVYFDTEFRHNMIEQQSDKYCMRNIYTREYNITDVGQELGLMLNFAGLLSGIFVEGIRLKDINNLSLVQNNIIRFNYSQRMISKLCHVISDDLFYISFNNRSWNDYDKSGSIYIRNKLRSYLSINLKSSHHPIEENKVRIHTIIPHPYEHISPYNFNCTFREPDPKDEKEQKKLFGEGKLYQLFISAKAGTECIISYEPIEVGAEYKKCNDCNNCFNPEQLEQYFDSQSHKKCPYCTNEWSSDQTYRNTE